MQATKGGASSLARWWKRYREQFESASEHSIRVFVRSWAPRPGSHDQRTGLIKRLEQATADERVGSYDVTVVGRDICVCEECRRLSSGDLRQTILDLAQWRSGGIRSTGFTEREVRSEITGEQYRTISPPETTLGIYVDGSLTGVFPCRADGVNYCPDAYLSEVAEENSESVLQTG